MYQQQQQQQQRVCRTGLRLAFVRAVLACVLLVLVLTPSTAHASPIAIPVSVAAAGKKTVAYPVAPMPVDVTLARPDIRLGKRQAAAAPTTTAVAKKPAATPAATSGKAGVAAPAAAANGGKKEVVAQKVVKKTIIQTALGPLAKEDLTALVNDESKFNFQKPIYVGAGVGGVFALTMAFVLVKTVTRN